MTASLDPAPPLATVWPAAGAKRLQFFAGPLKQVELSVDVVVRCHPLIATGRQPIHQPATRYSDQLPLHRTQLPQRHCA